MLAVIAHHRVSGEKALEKLGWGVMLTEDNHCLYNKASSWSIWGKSFGTHWILVAADPCITVTFDNPLMYGLFSSRKGP